MEFKRLAVKIVGEKGWQTQIAHKLDLTPRTVRRYLHTGRIPKVVSLALRALAKGD